MGVSLAARGPALAVLTEIVRISLFLPRLLPRAVSQAQDHEWSHRPRLLPRTLGFKYLHRLCGRSVSVELLVVLKSPRHRDEDAGTHSGKIITLMADLDILSRNCTHVSQAWTINLIEHYQSDINPGL